MHCSNRPAGCLHFVFALVVAAQPAAADVDSAAPTERRFAAVDTFVLPDKASPDAAAMLAELNWHAPPSDDQGEPDAGRFTVRCATEQANGDYIVRFDSPRPLGRRINDTVIMEWYVARDRGGAKGSGPAMLVLHVLDGQMVLARMIARTFSHNGIHAFVMHMPGFGDRKSDDEAGGYGSRVKRMQQAVADARRARDAIAVLPQIDDRRIGIAGTSLGAFVAAVTAGLDRPYDPVFIVLGGGDLHGMLVSRLEALPRLRRQLQDEGITDKSLKELTWRVEPTRLAHRLDRERTWLFSAVDDQVVPPASARALANAADLSAEHHVWLSGNHYSCAVNLPNVLLKMVQIINQPDDPRPAESPDAPAGENAAPADD